jgi:hypothetical protein
MKTIQHGFCQNANLGHHPPWRHFWRAVFFAFSVFVSFIDTCLASPEDWERLPDGRVVIQVKDVRLALPSEGEDIKFITFSDIPNRKDMTLKSVIAAPDDARKMFAEARLINVLIANGIDRKDLWLGKFARWELRSASLGIVIGAGAVGNCEGWERDFERLKTKLAPNDPRIGNDGLAEFPFKTGPVYVQTREQSFFSGVSCDTLSFCYVQKCLGDQVGVHYNFSEREHDRSSWERLTARL